MTRKLGLKERQQYNDISWLMPHIDVLGVLDRLNIANIKVSGDQIYAMCPDHKIFVGRDSSHPKWTVNVNTGKTFCFTESRGSNLLYTVCRLLECDPKEAVAFLINNAETEINLDTLMLSKIRSRISRITVDQESRSNVEPIFGLEEIKNDMISRRTSESLYNFFVNPSNKRPTNISKSTVDRYKVFQRNWGYYSGRAIIPFELDSELVGFCAIDIFGKDEWLKNHPLKSDGDYRKVLYPKNFKTSDYLFGYDDCIDNADYIILTEGAREVMKLWQFGYRNSVAILGGNVSNGHLKLLSKKRPKKIILMFDGDKKGYEFTEKANTKLESLFSVEKCFLPYGRDPKNLEKREVDFFISRIYNSDKKQFKFNN